MTEATLYQEDFASQEIWEMFLDKLEVPHDKWGRVVEIEVMPIKYVVDEEA